MARMLRHNIGRLPVVDRANAKRVIGYLGRASILGARERYHREEEQRERGFGLDDGAVDQPATGDRF